MALVAFAGCGDDEELNRVDPNDWQVVSEGAPDAPSPDLGVAAARIEELDAGVTATSLDPTGTFDVVDVPQSPIPQVEETRLPAASRAPGVTTVAPDPTRVIPRPAPARSVGTADAETPRPDSPVTPTRSQDLKRTEPSAPRAKALPVPETPLPMPETATANSAARPDQSGDDDESEEAQPAPPPTTTDPQGLRKSGEGVLDQSRQNESDQAA